MLFKHVASVRLDGALYSNKMHDWNASKLWTFQKLLQLSTSLNYYKSAMTKQVFSQHPQPFGPNLNSYIDL